MATILLADDDPDNREIYQVILEHFGHSVCLAPNGRVAVRLARERRPDLIVMDVRMPVMDGVEATRILKADPETAGICILALTAHALTTDRERMLTSGFDAYLAKPLEPRCLVAEVERLIDGRTQSA
jgi:two-component system cell cycle response regulator DivK